MLSLGITPSEDRVILFCALITLCEAGFTVVRSFSACVFSPSEVAVGVHMIGSNCGVSSRFNSCAILIKAPLTGFG